MSYRTGKEIIRERLKTASVDEIADCLDVNVAHVYNVEYRGVSPTLYKALIEAGWVDPPPKVYTLAFRFKCREDFEKARRAAGRQRTEWLLSVIDDDHAPG